MGGVACRKADPRDCIVQCDWHLGYPSEGCRLVQVTHDSSDPKSWQRPLYVCRECREHLRGQWRYAR